VSEKMSEESGRVGRSHNTERVRETGLSRERADDQRRLAELEEFVKKHKRNRAGRMDAAAVDKTSSKTPPRKRRASPGSTPRDTARKRRATNPQHLDVTI
jgi:hypothetical protein